MAVTGMPLDAFDEFHSQLTAALCARPAPRPPPAAQNTVLATFGRPSRPPRPSLVDSDAAERKSVLPLPDVAMLRRRLYRENSRDAERCSRLLRATRLLTLILADFFFLA